MHSIVSEIGASQSRLLHLFSCNNEMFVGQLEFIGPIGPVS